MYIHAGTTDRNTNTLPWAQQHPSTLPTIWDLLARKGHANFGFSVGESPAGVSRDDHPQADVRDGQAYLTEIYNALRASPDWERTAS